MKGTEVKRGYEIELDHCILKMDKIWRQDSQNTRKEDKTKKKKIQSYKIKDPEKATEYKVEVDRGSRSCSYSWDSDDVYTYRRELKRIYLDSSSKIYGKQEMQN